MDIRGLIQKPGVGGMGGMGGSSIPGLSVGSGMGGPAPASPAGFDAFGGNATGTTALGPGGGMDVMGSIKKNSDFGTQFVRSPGGW